MNELKRYLIDEAVEDYAEGRITRRQAMSTLGGLVGMVMAGQLLAACRRAERAAAPPGAGSDAPAPKPMVAADDPDVVAAAVSFPGDGATLGGYLARPSKDGTFPIVLVCHENRGL